MEDDTRAEIARRRLAALTADFDRRYGAEPPDRAPASDAASDAASSAGAQFAGAEEGTASPASDPSEARSTGHRKHAADRSQPNRRVRWSVSAWHVRVIIGLTAAAVVVIAGWLVTTRPHQTEAVQSATVSTGAQSNESAGGAGGGAGDSAGEAAGDEDLIIDVAGKVKKPGIVELPAGSRVVDAIKAAGGAKAKADTTTLNLARELNDGEQILVGIDQPGGGPAGVDGDSAGHSGRKVNVNTASSEELQALPGVGPATAQAIIDFRTENGGFTHVDDLMDVKGIGPVTLEDLKDRVTV